MSRSSCLSVAAVFCAAVALPVAAAQSYPAKPLRFIVPFTPGGSQDIIARLVGQKVGERAGRQVVIDNRPGAAGLEVPVWAGVLTAAGVPKTAIDWLHREMAAVPAQPDTRERLEKLGSDIVSEGPQAFDALLKTDLARWAKVIRAANIRLD